MSGLNIENLPLENSALVDDSNVSFSVQLDLEVLGPLCMEVELMHENIEVPSEETPLVYQQA